MESGGGLRQRPQRVREHVHPEPAFVTPAGGLQRKHLRQVALQRPRPPVKEAVLEFRVLRRGTHTIRERLANAQRIERGQKRAGSTATWRAALKSLTLRRFASLGGSFGIIFFTSLLTLALVISL